MGKIDYRANSSILWLATDKTNVRTAMCNWFECPPLTSGCSEGLDAFIFFFKQRTTTTKADSQETNKVIEFIGLEDR